MAKISGAAFKQAEKKLMLTYAVSGNSSGSSIDQHGVWLG